MILVGVICFALNSNFEKEGKRDWDNEIHKDCTSFDAIQYKLLRIRYFRADPASSLPFVFRIWK